MLRIKQFFALAGLAAVEAIRQPVCLLLTITCIILISLVPLMLMHYFGEDGKLVRDSALAFHFVFGIFLAGYAASSSLAREMRTGTASTVLSKPVSRQLFFFAKFAGIATLIITFSACALTATLLSERVAEKFCFTSKLVGYFTDWQTGKMLLAAPFIACLFAGIINCLTRRPFASIAFGLLLFFLLLVFFISGFFNRTGQPAPLDFRVQWRIIPASILITIALIVLSAIALSLSTSFSAVPTLAICGAIFMIGLISDFLFGRHAAGPGIAAFFYCIIPNWQHFWMSDALNEGGLVPWTYVLNVGLYALMYLAGILCIGVFLFSHAEIE